MQALTKEVSLTMELRGRGQLSAIFHAFNLIVSFLRRAFIASFGDLITAIKEHARNRISKWTIAIALQLHSSANPSCNGS